MSIDIRCRAIEAPESVMAETITRASGRSDFSSRAIGTSPSTSPAEAPWSQTRGPPSGSASPS